MKCYECGMPILDDNQRVMQSVRMFRWSSTQVPFHTECWEKRKVSDAKKRHAKMFAESLILLTVALIATYVAI